MNLLRPSKTFRCRWLAAGCFVLLAAWSAPAQTPQITRPLTSVDIARWLPRLRAEAAAFTRQVGEAREAVATMQSATDGREALLADMASGRTNIAEWMRSHTDYALVPAGAVYCDKCSQALIYEMAGPTATFTFEKESPYHDLLRRAAAGDEAARDEFNNRRGEEEANGRTATQQAMNDFVAGIAAFYRDRGFVEAEGDRPITATFLHSPDQRVLVEIWEVNPYCGLLPSNITSPCAALPTGPLVEIKFTGDLLNLSPPAESSEKPADASAAEEKTDAGKRPSTDEKSDADYERVRDALIMAHTDAANPEALEFELPPDAPAEVKAELAPIAAEFAVRKANMLIYKAHEAELAPLLEALLQLQNK